MENHLSTKWDLSRIYVNPHLEKVTPTYKLNPLLLSENSQPPAFRQVLKMSQPTPAARGGRNYVFVNNLDPELVDKLTN